METKSKVNGICRCHACGKNIVGMKYSYKGKVYCYDCFNVLTNEEEKNEKEGNEVFSYIKSQFSIREIPLEVANKIKSVLKNKEMTVYGIKATIRYYYLINGNTFDITYLGYVLSSQYEAAKKYYQNLKQLQKANESVNINVPANVVKIDINDLHKPKKKPDYDINDLV